jgi:hypothetical protein
MARVVRLAESSARGDYRPSDEYVTTASQDVPLQLSKAGVRLAFVPNNAPSACPAGASR